MGTRNLTCVFKNGEYKIAQYGQWDGYPSGQGLTALEFLRGRMDRPVFERKLDTLSWSTAEERKAQWVECGADPDNEWVGFSIAKIHTEKFPQDSRDTGAAILDLVQDSDNPLKLNNEIEFASDSLFCEWAWVVDLDAETFEAYKGFNQKPLLDVSERFYSPEPNEGGYYPIRLVASWNLADLPTNEQFLAAFAGEEE